MSIPARGLALIAAAALAVGGMAAIDAVFTAPAAADDSTIKVLPTDIGTEVGDMAAAWTKANGDNLEGRYEIVEDPTDGVVLELETLGGPVGTGTQAKFMHYFASGAYPTTDDAASVVGTDPIASIPLGNLLVDPVSANYRASTYLSLQIEIRFGADKFATIYQNGVAAASWMSFSVDPAKRWTISGPLTDPSGTPIALCGAGGDRACVNGADIKLADLLAGLADQDPRAISVGVNKGRDTNVANAGLVQVRDISFGGTTFRFALPPTLHVDPYFVAGALYKGIGVDVKATGVTDATEVRVTVHRSIGGDVVKTSKPSGTILASVNAGNAVTVPIVIQPGTYDEAGSSSWFKPIAVWTPSSVPTLVTVTITRTYGPDLVTTLPISGSSAGVLPTTTPTAPIVVEIPTDGPTYEVEVPADAEDVKLNLGTPAATADGVEVSVPVEVVVTTQVGANVTIAANTKVTSTDSTWDGVLQLPKVQTDVVVPAASGQATTVGVAIELGSPTMRLDFDTPVKLVLAGQAGKRAGYIQPGYIQPGIFHAIDTACPVTVPIGMTTDECWANDGADLVIWTTHFTTFVSYDSVAVPTPSGGGGGGSGTSSGDTSGGSSSGTTGGTGSAIVPAPVATVTPKPKPTPSATATTRPTSTPDVPEAAAEPAAVVPQAGGGFDPFLLIVIVIAVAVLGAGVATVVTLRRRARG